GEDRHALGEQARLEKVAMASHRADPDLVTLPTVLGPRRTPMLADIPELASQVVDVDQVVRRREPQLHHRQQRVAAGQDAGLGTKVSQQRQRVLDARRALVLKWCRYLHRRPLAR